MHTCTILWSEANYLVNVCHALRNIIMTATHDIARRGSCMLNVAVYVMLDRSNPKLVKHLKNVCASGTSSDSGCMCHSY